MDQTPDSRYSWEAILETVHRDLRQEFRGSHPPEVIEAAARDSVGELRREPVRVKAFLPILVGKRARRRLREIQIQPATT